MTSPLRVNLTSDEAESKTLEPLPSGKYLCNIVNGQVREVKPGRTHTGKPYWGLQFVVQEGPHAGRSIFSTVMLFDGALYSLSQLMQALGYEVNVGEFHVPPIDSLIGKSLYVRGRRQPAKTDDDGRDIPERFEVKGYMSSGDQTKPDTDTSLLP
jgi:Protein of unknown function (DUF669)